MRDMRTTCIRLIAILILASGFINCTNNDIIIDVSGLDPDIVQLEVSASLANQSLKTITLSQNLSQFVLNLPPGSEGNLVVTLTGLAADECKVAAGTGTVDFRLDQKRPTEMSIPLQRFPAQRCTLTVEVIGGGAVHSLNASTLQEDQKIVCGDGDTRCSTDYIGLNNSIFLKGILASGTYDTAFFSPFPSCSGRSCQLSISQKATVRVYFIPRFCMTPGWCSVPSPTTSNLLALWGQATNLWAVGDKGTILHFDGLNWSVDAMSGRLGAPTTALVGLWGSSPSDIWAVGTEGTILHYDGHLWQVDSRSASLTSRTLKSVWGTAAKDVWAVGSNGVLLHFDGTQWNSAPPLADPGGTALNSLWGNATSGLWAVGQGGNVLRNDGTGWRSDAQAAADLNFTNLTAVWGYTANEVWSVGYAGLIARWNGTSWNEVSPRPTTANLSHVWGPDPQNGWAVGTAGSILHMKAGGPWTQEMSGTNQTLNSVWGDGINVIWSVGVQGTLLTYQP